VITAVEAGQKSSKKARKAFEEGIKFEYDNKLDEALTSFLASDRLLPEYFQALTAALTINLANTPVGRGRRGL
jgi:hypothetical protein